MIGLKILACSCHRFHLHLSHFFGCAVLFCHNVKRGRGGLMVSALAPGLSGPGSSPGQGHCVVFLGKTLNSHSASLHPGV